MSLSWGSLCTSQVFLLAFPTNRRPQLSQELRLGFKIEDERPGPRAQTPGALVLLALLDLQISNRELSWSGREGGSPYWFIRQDLSGGALSFVNREPFPLYPAAKDVLFRNLSAAKPMSVCF